MEEARYYTILQDGRARCTLCPHYCLLREGSRGLCLARSYHGGKIITENYGKVTALHLDPIEKKPLYHFFPGKKILSVGSFGCNLSCGWCQNCEIAHHGSEAFGHLPVSSVASIVQSAASSESIGLAYTYNEPGIWFEFMMEMASMVRETGMKNVVVSNGYLNPRPLEELLDVADAFNIDLKGFSEAFYRRQAGGKLQPVLDTLKAVARKGIHQEVTFLVIPGLNDDLSLFREMVRWISSELGPKTVLHLSRYFPAGKMQTPPTPVKLLEEMLHAAREVLNFVYPGNVSLGNENLQTRCPACQHLLVERYGYQTSVKGLSFTGACEKCGEQVAICS